MPVHHIRLFAAARDLAGSDMLALELPPSSTVADLRRALVITRPALASLSPFLLFAIGTDYAAEADGLPADAEVAVFPPVSGG